MSKLRELGEHQLPQPRERHQVGRQERCQFERAELLGGQGPQRRTKHRPQATFVVVAPQLDVPVLGQCRKVVQADAVGEVGVCRPGMSGQSRRDQFDRQREASQFLDDPRRRPAFPVVVERTIPFQQRQGVVASQLAKRQPPLSRPRRQPCCRQQVQAGAERRDLVGLRGR